MVAQPCAANGGAGKEEISSQLFSKPVTIGVRKTHSGNGELQPFTQEDNFRMQATVLRGVASHQLPQTKFQQERDRAGL